MGIFSILFNMKVCCVFLLESPHRGDSYEYTQYTIFNKKKKKENPPQSSQICNYGFLSPRTTKLWRGYRVCPVRMYVSTYVRTFVRSYVHPLQRPHLLSNFNITSHKYWI